MTAMIELRDLSKTFGSITAVDRVSFSVERGAVLGFLGPNGAGKSTTMKMLAGFLTPTGGTASILGHDVVEDSIAAKRELGYLPEGAPAYGDMTPGGFLEFIARIRGLSGAAKTRAIGLAIERANLSGVLRQPIDTLSKGFKRRVGLAQALLHDPAVLILDEPTDGLDPNQKHEVRALIQEIAGDKAIIVSTHILEEVEAVCTRAVIIAGGRVVADGTPAELAQRDPRHNAVHLALAPERIEPARLRLTALAGVRAVEAEAGGLTVLTGGAATLIAEIGALARAEGWAPSEIRQERGRLETVFRAVTRPTPLAA